MPVKLQKKLMHAYMLADLAKMSKKIPQTPREVE